MFCSVLFEHAFQNNVNWIEIIARENCYQTGQRAVKVTRTPHVLRLSTLRHYFMISPTVFARHALCVSTAFPTPHSISIISQWESIVMQMNSAIAFQCESISNVIVVCHFETKPPVQLIGCYWQMSNTFNPAHTQQKYMHQLVVRTLIYTTHSCQFAMRQRWRLAVDSGDNTSVIPIHTTKLTEIHLNLHHFWISVFR